MISKDEERIIRTARKYKLSPDNTLKCEVFALFDEEHSPSEVRYILTYYKHDMYEKPKTFTDTIRRYYYDWKKAQ